jgi:hypothetical protein
MTLLLFFSSFAFARFDERQWRGSHGPEHTRDENGSLIGAVLATML